ncbi:MAG: hypothetical protein DRR19_29755, partial [Candidatus Parabeggiatoa sp. nov. 1]
MQGAFAGNIGTSDKYAWNTNSGWVNFNPANGGVTVYADHLEGYAWSENVGWIRLGTHESGGTHNYTNNSNTTYGVNNNSGTLSGYGWSTSVGWIKFNPTNGGVTINATTGDFDGYAWAENVGWIHFQNANPAYKVKQRLLPNEGSLKVIKTGDGRGTIRAKIKGESWTLICKSACQQASYDYAPDSEVIVSAYPEKGFTFNGWGDDCTGANRKTTLTIDTAKTCTAQFEPDDSANLNLLTVNQDGTGNGTITTSDGSINCGSNCSAFYMADKKVRLKAIPAASNLFMGWSGDCSGLNTSVRVTMDAAKSCTATFKAHNINDMFTLTVNNGGDGLGTISGRVKGEKNRLICKGKKGCKQAQHEYTSGTKVILSAIPNAGFEFTAGSGDCPWERDVDKKGRLRASATVIMAKAKECSANFGLKTDPNITWHQFTVYTAG